MDSISSYITPVLAVIVSVGSLLFAYRRNNETEANDLISLLGKKVELQGSDIKALQAEYVNIKRRLEDCESEKMRLMKMLFHEDRPMP